MWEKTLLCCALLWTSSLAAAQKPLSLVGNATVREARIRFSDLLPDTAPENLRRLAAAVDLGRAPLPGSDRVFTADELRSALRDLPQLDIPKQVVVHGGGWPLQETSIRAALSTRAELAALLSGAKLAIPAELASRSPNPSLELVDLRADAQEALAFLRCRERSQCGSFLVRALFDQPLTLQTGTNTAVSPRRLIQPGRPALLSIEQAGIRITVRVLPLRAAGLGETVRVVEKKSRRIFVAQVVAEDQLEANPGGVR